MKASTLVKGLCTSAIALSIAAVPFVKSASAQTDTAPDTAPGTTTTIPDTTTQPAVPNSDVSADTNDDGFDWGWLGLLGLIGLAGLARKPEERTQYRDPNADPATTTTTRSDYYR